MSQSGIKFRSSSVKSLKISSILQPSKLQIISKHPFEINPAHIVFKDIEQSKDYQVKVEIRNLTKKPQRIRFEKFGNPRFVLEAVPQTEIAVGLSIFVTVRYQCMEEVAETEVLKVHSSDGFTQELSIDTYPKKSKIVFEPFVNLGFVEQNTQCIKQITIQNQGQKSGQLKFISNQPTMLTVQPQTINLGVKSSSTLTIKYKPLEAGYFKGIIEIKSSQMLAKNFIEVVATSLEKARFIVNPNKFNSEEPDMVFDFRTVYAGQQKVLKAFLINNSPKPMKFKTLTKKGLLQNSQEATMNHTPAEEALEEREKVFLLKPQEGTVEPFTQFELELKCQSKISYKQKTYVTSYAMADYSQQGSIASMRNSKDFKHEKTYEYTAIVKSQEQKPLLLHLKATITCPQIKISKKSLLFGDCLLQQTKKEQLFFENKNRSEKVYVVLPKIPYVDFVPAKFVLQSERSKMVEVIFRPKVIGKIDETQLIVINDVYEVPLRCMGIVKNERSISQKQLSKLSIDDGKVNESPNKKLSSRRLSVFQTEKSQKTLENDSEMNYLTHRKLGSLGNLQMDSKTKAVSMFIENKQKFSKLLTSRRQDRQKKQAQKQIKDKYSQMKQKLQKQKKNQTYDDQGLPQSSPVDIEFELGSIKDIREKQPKLSKLPQKLYVTKHIGSYEPEGPKNGAKSSFARTSEDKPKRIFPQVPEIFNQRRQIERQLLIEQFQLIQVPETKIYFGQVYIKSESTRCFWLKNNTRFAVSCKVVFNSPQLAKSYSKAQTIPSYQEAGFPLVLCRHALGDYFAEGQYVINEKYRYKLSVVAKVGEVVISVNKENLKFEFPQNNLEMSMVENVMLTNPGNSEAKFRWTLGKDKYFIPKPIQGIVLPKQSITVPIELNLASIIKSLKKPGDLRAQQKLSLKILDGQQKPVSCIFSIMEPKYTAKCQLFTKKSTIFLNNEISEFFQIKNTTKEAIVIHMFPVGVEIVSSDKIRLMPDETKRIKVKFIGEKVGQFQCSMGLSVRGGVRKEFEFIINVIEPELVFSDQWLQMQPLIVRSTKGEAFFTLCHKQQLPIPLVFDFRPKRYNKTAPQHIEHLQLQILNQGENLQSVSPTLKSQQDQNIINQNLVQQKIDIDEIEDRLSNQSFDDEEETLEKDQQQMRRYRFMAKPGVEYKFRVEFVAPQVGTYKIKVPVEIEKSVKVSNSPVLKCQAIQPRFMFEPSNIDFKKKYIGRPQRSFPKIVEILVRNDNFQPIQWSLSSTTLQQSKIFTFQPSTGHLLPNQSTRIKALFNPFSIGQFTTTLPLYIKSQKQPTRIKFCNVSLKGTSSQPQLYFNKREVIMPVVPLGVETGTFFRILNDGYDNLNLAWEFEDDVMGLDVKVAFPEGNNVGISRQKVKVDLTWKYQKPISFTIVMIFKDDMGRKFRIPISGTTDNSILTNYMYLLRNQHKFKIKQQGALQLFQLTHNTTATTSLQRKHSSHSLKSNSTNRSIMSYLGIAPINPYVLSTTLEYIKKYLNENVLTIPISEFPQSMVEGEGRQMVEVMTVTAGKGAKYPWVYQGNAKGQEKVKKLMVQYSEMIKMLKTQGAMLNHIRPQYLLSFQDLNLFLSTLPSQKSRCYMPNLLKINSGLYNYLSVESWTSLLYQILKLNVVSRVSVKNIKLHVPFYKEKDIPSQYLEKSNFLSVSESILLHWCEEAYHEVLFKEVRLMNFDRDFKSGVVLAAVIERYAKNSLTARLAVDAKTEEDDKKNAKIICDALEEMGLLGHIQPKYIYSPFQRQMVMLVMYLYMYLPAYIPKDKPIVFDCVLGEEIIKSIQLKNPSSKPLKYKAKYVGSANFILLSDEVFTIEPKASYDFRIKYMSRFVRQIKGRVSFVNLKDKTTGQGSTLSGSTIVFELKSNTVQVLSEKTWKVASNLYEPSEYTVQVQNNIEAPENTEFTLKVKTEYIVESNNKKKSKSTEQANLSPQEQVQVVLFKTDTIKVKKGSIQPLSFTYLPMSLHRTKTYILFSNQFIGQFQHEIQATPQEPALTAQFKPNLTMYAGDVHDWEYMLTARNEFLQKAKKTYEGLTVKKVRGGTSNSPGKSKAKVVNTVEDGKDVVMGSKKYQISIQPNQNVSLVQNFVVLSQEVNKKDKKPKQEENQPQEPQSAQQNSIKFKFSCKQPIFQFPLKIRIKDSKSLDIRLYRLILTILPKPLAAVLEMTTPQRKQLIQELPFINHTEKDWNMKVNWTPGNGFALGGNIAGGFVVKRESIFKLPVVFKPKVKEDSQAKLVVMNPMTLDQFEYQIKGHVEDPLSQDHIDIYCGIIEPITRSLQLVNPYPQKSIYLRVQTDIPNFEGEERVMIPPNSKLTYSFKLTAMICGQFNSCITFWEVEGAQYFWFTVTVRTSVGSATMTVDVESQIRQRKVQQISIPMNFKLKAPEEFDVSVKGQGVLAPQKVTLYPEGNRANANALSIQYLPLKQGTSCGSLYLVNPRVGQVLIDLTLTCHPKPPNIYHLIKSPLGVGSKQQITLQNPINAKISISYTNSNPETFVIVTSQTDKKSLNKSIKLQPFEKKTIKVEYIPGSIDSIEKAQILFFSEQVGEWEYHFSGIGVAPTEFDPLIVYREVSWIEPSSIKFKNPFNYAISVGVKLIVQEEWQSIFRLSLIGKEIITIEPHGNIEIPFVFAPDTIAQYFCTVKILLSEKIFWTFPIVGIAQCTVKQSTIHLKAKCRQTVRIEKGFHLEGIEKFSNNNSYQQKFLNVPHDVRAYIDLFVEAQLTQKSLLNEKDNLVAQFIFRPMKPFKTTFDLSIERQNGGRWIYKLHIEATAPQFDDRIELQSAIMSTSSVSFKITNKDKKSVPFNAYLTQDSAHEFSVQPQSGILAKYGSKGTQIKISFTPVEYGKYKAGKLVIETQEMYWWYEIVGKLPKYVPPGKKAQSMKKL